MPFALDALVRPNIRRLRPYSSARHEFKGVAEVYLDANENPYDTGLNRYPDPLQLEVKRALSAYKDVPVDRIFLGNGSDEAIDLLLRIFCTPGRDAIITLPPTYGMYRVSADINDVAVREVPLDGDFQVDSAGVKAATDATTKLLFICSPNNPTGNAIDPVVIEALCNDFAGIVVVDEAYVDFSAARSATTLLDRYENLVVLQTFSKAWGLAGARLGMAFASPAIIALFNRVKPPYNVNQLTQAAALEALRHADRTEGWIAELLAERARLRVALEALPLTRAVYPSDANFLLARYDDPVALYDHLVRQRVVVRDRSKVLGCAGCLRFTVGTPAENERLLAGLRSFALLSTTT